MRRLFDVLLILAFLSSGAGAIAQEFSEEERLLGFSQQQRRNAQMDKERQSGADEVKKRRANWDEKLQASVEEYKASKARQKAALNESSPEYKEDVAFKKRQDKELEEARAQFVRERNRNRAQRKVTVKLTEEHEYGLDENPERVDISKRKLYGSNSSSSRGSFGGGRGSGRGDTDFGAMPAPPPDFNPPQSVPPPAPEFYEPEIPPPPPPADFDENIPPPIFDDNEF